MRRHHYIFLVTGIAMGLSSLLSPQVSLAEGSTKADPLSTKNIMKSVITPVTNRLWQAENPTTDEEWQQLEDTAITAIAAGKLIGLENTDVEWQAFTRAMTSAGIEALDAVRKKNMDALLNAGDRLYEPCEGCHLKYNPGAAE